MKKLILISIILISTYLNAQIYDKGLLVYRVTTAERLLLPAGTAEGELFYDTDTDSLWKYDGANWKEDVSTDENGNVGIGVSDPEEELHINDSLSQASIRIEGTSANIDFEDIDAPLNAKVFSMESNGGEFSINSLNDNYTFKATRFKIKSNGFVGVGTNNPQRNLHVVGRFRLETTTSWSPFELNRDSNSTAESAIRLNTNNTNKWFIGMDDNSTERMYITSYVATDNLILQNIVGGKVGIGTSSPDEKLEIEFGNTNKDIEFGVGTTDTDVTFITLRSPNGTKRYITVSDAGVVTTSTTKP